MHVSREDDVRTRFRAAVKASTRATAISGGALAVVGYPTWTAFDYLVEPTVAGQFLDLRLFLTIPIALLWLTIIFTRVGRLPPEPLMLGLLLCVNLGISLMIARVDEHYAAYALGLSLTVYAGAFLLLWSPAYMARSALPASRC